MTAGAVDPLARAHQLEDFGRFHPEAGGTIVLLGPREPGFWAHVTAEPEFADGAPDPLDRWSVRVIGALAASLGGRALFPFGGPPWHPFPTWALATGRAWLSPVGLLVHDVAGLMVSYRGAVHLPDRLDLPPRAPAPCDACAGQPCRTECPVGALTPGRPYDVAACRAHVRAPAGADCRAGGCRVRRACPIAQRYGRLAAQSAYHMRQFAP